MSSRYKNEVFACEKPGCGGTLVPIKISRSKKGDDAKVLGTCPSCTKSYEIVLPLDAASVAMWKAVAGKATFTCLACGKQSLKLLGIEGNPKDRRVVVTCVACEKRDTRIIDGTLLPHLEPYLPPRDRLSLTCGTCGGYLQEQPRCPSCGREVFCTKCGSYIPGSAKICPRCGDPVDPGKRR